MRVAIVCDNSTGTTRAAAEQMGEATRAAGPLQARGANVTGRFTSKWPSAVPDFATWLGRLDS